jgi:predicted RNase H-like HicB family nuclease
MDDRIVEVEVHHEHGGGYRASVSALPGCVTTAGDLDELLIMLTNAIGLYLSDPTRDASQEPDSGGGESTPVPPGRARHHLTRVVGLKLRVEEDPRPPGDDISPPVGRDTPHPKDPYWIDTPEPNPEADLQDDDLEPDPDYRPMTWDEVRAGLPPPREDHMAAITRVMDFHQALWNKYESFDPLDVDPSMLKLYDEHGEPNPFADYVSDLPLFARIGLFVAALGGHLEVRAEFPDGEDIVLREPDLGSNC